MKYVINIIKTIVGIYIIRKKPILCSFQFWRHEWHVALASCLGPPLYILTDSFIYDCNYYHIRVRKWNKIYLGSEKMWRKIRLCFMHNFAATKIAKAFETSHNKTFEECEVFFCKTK